MEMQWYWLLWQHCANLQLPIFVSRFSMAWSYLLHCIVINRLKILVKFVLFVWWQVEKQLLSEHLTTMLQKGLDSLMEENRVDELALLYGLLNRVKKGLLELCANFNSYIKVLIMTDYYSLVCIRLQFCTSRHIHRWKYGQWFHTNKFCGYPSCPICCVNNLLTFCATVNSRLSRSITGWRSQQIKNPD